MKAIKFLPISVKRLSSLALASSICILGGMAQSSYGLTSSRVRVQAPPTYEFINKKGERAIPYLFHIARPFSEGMAAVLLGEEWGYIDREGTLKIGANFKLARDFSEGLAAVKIGSDWGYTDTTGKVTIKPRFATADDFHNGLAVAFVAEGSKDFPKKVQEDANEILKGEKKLSTTKRALLAIVRSRKAGFIDRSGKFVIKPEYTAAFPFEDGLALVRDGDHYFFIDKTGKITIDPKVDAAKSFSNGHAAVRVGAKWGFIDLFGKMVIKPEFDEAQNFHIDLAAVKRGNLWGFVDTHGKWVIEPSFSSVWSGFKSGVAVCAKDVSPIKDSFGTVTKFNSGYVISRRQGDTKQFDISTTVLKPGYFSYPDYRFGLVAKDGVVVAPFKYGEIGELSDGLRTAELDGRYGYIDNMGNVAIKPRYKAAANFSSGLGMVKHGEITSSKVARAENLLKHSVPVLVRDPGLIRKDIEVASEVLKLDKENAQAYRDRGYFYCALQEYDKAVKDFGEVIRICPSSTEGYYWRGHAYLSMKEYDRAISDFSGAIKQSKSDDRLFAGRAQAYLAKDNIRYGLIDTALALRLNNQPFYHGFLADIFKKMGHNSRWLIESWKARRSTNLNPWPVWAETESELKLEVAKGEAHLKKLSNTKDADEERILVLSLLADSVDSLRRLKFREDKVLEIEPLLRQSLQYRQKASELAKGDAAKLVPRKTIISDLANSEAQLASWLTRKGMYDEAKESTDKAIKLAKQVDSTIKQADYLNDLARLYIKQKKFKDAESALTESLAISSKTKQTLMKIIRGQSLSIYAVLLNLSNREDEANKKLEGANKHLIIGTKLAFLPGPPMADKDTTSGEYYAFAEQCRGMGLIEMTRSYLDKTIELAKDNKEKEKCNLYKQVYLPDESVDLATEKKFLTGRTAEVAGDFISSEKIFTELAKSNSKFFWPHVALARLYREFGHFSKAEKSAKKALSINRDSVEALVELAKINIDRGRPERGITFIDRALEIDPNYQPAMFLDQILGTKN